jgi:purine-binding chemotaxis protein CheW
MGRMSEARKRAQRKPTEAEAPRPVPVTEPPPRAAAENPPAEEWVSREEPLVFPADPAPEPPASPSGRIQLPSSGLAEDILARAEAAAVAIEAPQAATPSAAIPRREAPPSEAARAAHNISFFASPVRDEKKAAELTEHLVTFFLAGEEYGVDVRLVQEIIRVADITQVPRAPMHIKGVINLRGRIIPVVDLKRKLNLGDVEYNRQARIVVVKVRDRLLGLLVDGASQVLKVPVAVIEAPPEEVSDVDSSYLRGVAKLEKRLVILVDLPKILAIEARDASSLPLPA